jgi:hypothetical protein
MKKTDDNIMNLVEFGNVLVALAKSDITTTEMAGIIKELYENHTNYDDLKLSGESSS